MPFITIEKVDPASFPEFLHLIDKLAEYEHLAPPDDEAKKRLRADGLSARPRYEAYLGYLDGIAVGYVTFYLTYSTFLARPTLFLEDIFVLEAHRKTGIGRAMFDFCRREAADRGCGRLDWMVLTWNEPAIRFYERCGGTRQDWYVYRIEGDRF
ncbi:MAG: GNAT family N-acetyltransferase [Methanomicrobiaceae archaeon]|nr:GNAT family N-acetyltransferase [Methanomicrobiaceae archaeon]